MQKPEPDRNIRVDPSHLRQRHITRLVLQPLIQRPINQILTHKPLRRQPDTTHWSHTIVCKPNPALAPRRVAVGRSWPQWPHRQP